MKALLWVSLKNLKDLNKRFVTRRGSFNFYNWRSMSVLFGIWGPGSVFVDSHFGVWTFISRAR